MGVVMSSIKVDEKIYCFWTDDNPLTPNRLKGLETMKDNLGIKIEFLDKNMIDWRGLIGKGLANKVTKEHNPYAEA